MAILKNLTPFYWGPKATSRRPPQVEMAVCVRGVFTIKPDGTVEAIEDEIDQGFMSGEVWSEDDPERKGPILNHNDFADWKPNADLLLRGTAYAPKGKDIVCDVAWGVGDWSKALRVYGTRVFKPGLLFGGSAGDPEPFTSIPLTWENAYGGEGHPINPAGKGFVGEQLPHIDDPNKPVTKIGAKARPATFLPISSLWPERANKVGKNYGKKWEKTRAPFVSDDFDWTHYNCAPADQQLKDRYLRGDETVWFQNLHPEHPRLETKLPGLRIRALVKTTDGKVHDVKMVLDTLFADVDAGRIILNWRGHTPIATLDMTDVAVVFIASEPLDSQPLPGEHYERQLLEFEEDPLGIKEKFPPGFMEVAEAVQAAEKAELHGTPKPDFKKVAASLPKGSIFPPWFVVAAGSLNNPAAAAGPAMDSLEHSPLPGVDIGQLVAKVKQTKNDPLALAAELEKLAADAPPQSAQTLNGMAEKLRKAEEAKELKKIKAVKGDPALSIEQIAAKLPPEQAEPMRKAAAKLREGLAKSAELKRQHAGSLPAPKPQAPPKPAVAALAALPAQIAAATAKLPEGTPPPKVEIPDLNAAVAQALAPLKQVKVPEPPNIDQMFKDQLAQMDRQEANYRGRFGDHPLLGLFGFGRANIMKAGRKVAALAPDAKAVDGLKAAEESLAEQGVSEEALEPLADLRERLIAMLARLPGATERPPERDFAYHELPGEDFSGQDLSGKSFACAQLKQANFSGANLTGADLTQADLTQADLSGANLSGARIKGAMLDGAKLVGADLSGAIMIDASVTGADLSQAILERADATGVFFSESLLPGARLAGANLTDCDFMTANLTQADLSGATMEQASLQKADLSGANLSGAMAKFADLTKSTLTGANLTGIDLTLGMATQLKGSGLNLSNAILDLARFEKSVLNQANLQGARCTMGSFAGCHFNGADLRGVSFERVDMSGSQMTSTNLAGARLERVDLRDTQAKQSNFDDTQLEQASATGEASFESCTFRRAKGHRSVWMDVDLTGSDFSHATMQHALLQGAKGRGINFFAADLKHANFRRSELSHTRFVSADLDHVDLCLATLEAVQFTKANCYEVKIMDSTLTDCDFLEASLYRARFDRTEGAPR